MSTILVTGGAGYIGSQVARELLRLGEKVVILDNLSTGSKLLVPQGALFVRGDVADIPLVESLLKHGKIEEVMHFAAFVDVEESMQRPDKYYVNNTDGTRHLLFAAKSTDVKRFIFSSTAAVYGTPSIVPTPEGAVLDPKTSHYGLSKARAEESIRKYDMGHAILRYFNVAGPGYVVSDEMPTHLIRTAVRVALGDLTSLKVFGTDYPTPDGSAVRDYIHVSDLVRAHIDVLKYLRNGGKSDTFNVGNAKGYSVLEVVNAVGRVLGKPLPVLYSGRRPGDAAINIADNRKLVETVGWRAKRTSLDEMILGEIEWVKSHRGVEK